MSALGRAVGNISACKHLKIQAKEVEGYMAVRAPLQQGNALKYPKWNKKTTHAIKTKKLRKSNGLRRSDVN